MQEVWMDCPTIQVPTGTAELSLNAIRTENHTQRKPYAQKIIRTEKSYAQKNHTHRKIIRTQSHTRTKSYAQNNREVMVP